MSGYRRPESILVVVYTDQAEVLLLRRASPFQFWQSVTGSLDAHEDPGDAARRELLEEMGLRCRDNLIDTNRSREFEIDPRWRDRDAPDVATNTEYEFRYRLTSSAEIRLDRIEHSDYQWLDVDSAIERVWSWTNKEALEQLREDL